MKRKQAIIIQILAVSEVSVGSYCNRNPNSGTDTFYVVTCDKFKQSRSQCLAYLLQMINSSGLYTRTKWKMSNDDGAPKSIE